MILIYVFHKSLSQLTILCI